MNAKNKPELYFTSIMFFAGNTPVALRLESVSILTKTKT